MVMGGLIGETSGNTLEGPAAPLAHSRSSAGLFGEQSLTNNRTELVMFITPRVVENENDLKNTIEDLRRRMYQIDDTFDVFRRAKAPDPYARLRRSLATADACRASSPDLPCGTRLAQYETSPFPDAFGSKTCQKRRQVPTSQCCSAATGTLGPPLMVGTH